jgi:hypothetical protein
MIFILTGFRFSDIAISNPSTIMQYFKILTAYYV